MTRKTRAGESRLNHAAIEQLCAQTTAKSASPRPFEPAPPRGPIREGSLAFTALELLRMHEPPRDYATENAITKAKALKRKSRRQSNRYRVQDSELTGDELDKGLLPS